MAKTKKAQQRIPFAKQKRRELFLKKRAGILNLSYLGDTIPRDIFAAVEQKTKTQLKKKPKKSLNLISHKSPTIAQVYEKFGIRMPPETPKLNLQNSVGKKLKIKKTITQTYTKIQDQMLKNLVQVYKKPMA